MLKRKAYDKLIQWKLNKNKKALCIIGARQIGKTTLIRKFGQEYYENFIEINFVTDDKAKLIFSDKLDATTLITNLTAYVQKPMTPGKTLVLFDEVQECPEARTAIKFLVEDGRFDYIESGSLLGVKSKEVKSYPVGFEEIYRMYPMDFEEFLWAIGVQTTTIDYLNDCFTNLSKVSDSVDETMKKLFSSYVVVGGMPEVVQTYVNTHDIGQVINIQNSILEQYRQDISKYASNNEKIKIKAIFDSIPAQLNDKNRRFFVNSISSTARMNRYDNSFKWLEDAGVALPCYNVEAPIVPLGLNEKHSLFKLFMNDIGLLCALYMNNIQFDILRGNLDINMGSILEDVIGQQLKTNGYNLYYFDSNKYGEVDFVIGNGFHIDVVEVKSGNDYKKHKALDNISNGYDWKFNHRYVLCKGNVEENNGIIYLPWYMFIFIKPQQIPQKLIYEVDLSNLK